MTTWKGQEFEREWHRAMLEWIDGGRQHDKAPRNMWESRLRDSSQDWSSDGHTIPFITCHGEYRWKPKPKRTVTINGKTLVASEVVAPADGTSYWIIDSIGETSGIRWDSHRSDVKWLKASNVFLTREDAQNMADWLVKCRRGET